MTHPNKDVDESTPPLPIFWQNFFVWLAGFMVFFTLRRIFELSPRPAEISLIELVFFVGVFILGRRQLVTAKKTGKSRWQATVELSSSLVMVLGLLILCRLGVGWLANHFDGGWRLASGILKTDTLWLCCFLLAIYQPATKMRATSLSDKEQPMEAKP